ncbi:hypothetical protein Sulac_2361 [Sulfobacillus acidophilus DSM 10332]|uniref:DoxX family protein n=1 Tax=Sulfobacillus acidophilus (strain ATCC 700253 / DSM 10332 / NAL) TaxID=679936 RepID=G8TUV4_SULAD|nr:hypothetical protein Sulac_2361 [Sulfobacillus acidophilus DSM 10332]
MDDNRWWLILRTVDGGYFLWRGIHKWLVPARIWLVPRVTQALPTTPLAPWIRAWVFPHAETFGLTLGTVEILAGGLLLWGKGSWGPPLVLACLNLLFFLTLGFREPHDLALNLLMGILNVRFMVERLSARKAPTASI